jgi:hypothetical protein
MVNKTSLKRKTFVAREDLLNRLSKVAQERGCSLYELVNEIFELAVASDNLGANLKMAVDSRRKMDSAKSAGLVLGLENLWYEMADLAYEKQQKSAMKSWFDAGIWFATRYTTGEIEGPFSVFKQDILSFTWNAAEFTFEENKRNVSVRIMSPRFTEAYTLLFSSFLEGALKTFGFAVTEKSVSRGVIRLEGARTGAL